MTKRAGTICAVLFLSCAPVTGKNAGDKGPWMIFEGLHFMDAEGEDVRWEGRARDGTVEGERQHMTCRGIHLEFAPGGGIRWEIEGTDGTWEPEKNMMRSDRMVTIRGPGLVLTGHRLAVDFSSDTVSLGEGVTASVEGFWLEQK